MSDCAQFFDAEKDVAILGDDEETIEYLSANPATELPKNTKRIDLPTRGMGMEEGNRWVSEFNCMMTAGSSLPAKRREQANIALQMYRLGALSLESLLKKLNAVGSGLPSDAKAELMKIRAEHALNPPPQKPIKGKMGVAAEAAPQ